MTPAMRFLGDLTPLKYVVFTLQDPWFSFGWDPTTYIVLIAVTVGASVASLRLFQWE